MTWSGRVKHRDRDPGRRQAEEKAARGRKRAFRMTDAERQQVARALRHIDEARAALESQQDPRNRQILRELRASADRIFDLINELEEIDG